MDKVKTACLGLCLFPSLIWANSHHTKFDVTNSSDFTLTCTAICDNGSPESSDAETISPGKTGDGQSLGCKCSNSDCHASANCVVS